jgi:hypothetical protein
MKEVLNTVLLLLILVGAMVLALWIAGHRLKKACNFILQDLRTQNAVNPASAVALPYCRRQILRLGLRDYRPQALEQLLKHDLVRATEAGTFYLGRCDAPEGSGQKPGAGPVQPS